MMLAATYVENNFGWEGGVTWGMVGGGGCSFLYSSCEGGIEDSNVSSC